MRQDLYPAGVPRLNHVAVSLPADQLDEAGRAAITDFYGECFGWTELDSETVDRTKLILAIGHWDQFLFIHAEDEPMRSPRLDHFGVSVGALADREAPHARGARRAQDDSAIDVIDLSVDDFDVLKVHSFYVRHLLPMMVEVQYWEFP